MVSVVNESPFSECLPSASLEHEYDQSGITMAVVLALSPQPARPAHPPEIAMLAVAPKSTVLAEATAMAPPKAEPHQWQHTVLQS